MRGDLGEQVVDTQTGVQVDLENKQIHHPVVNYENRIRLTLSSKDEKSSKLVDSFLTTFSRLFHCQAS